MIPSPDKESQQHEPMVKLNLIIIIILNEWYTVVNHKPDGNTAGTPTLRGGDFDRNAWLLSRFAGG